MRVLLLLALPGLLIACASANPRTPATTTPARGAAAPPLSTTSAPEAPAPERRGTSDPGTRWMPIQPRGALAAETEPQPPSAVRPPPSPARPPNVSRPAIMPGTPPRTPAEWTTPPQASEAGLGDPPAGTGLPPRRPRGSR